MCTCNHTVRGVLEILLAVPLNTTRVLVVDSNTQAIRDKTTTHRAALDLFATSRQLALERTQHALDTRIHTPRPSALQLRSMFCTVVAAIEDFDDGDDGEGFDPIGTIPSLESLEKLGELGRALSMESSLIEFYTYERIIIAMHQQYQHSPRTAFQTDYADTKRRILSDAWNQSMLFARSIGICPMVVLNSYCRSRGLLNDCSVPDRMMRHVPRDITAEQLLTFLHDMATRMESVM